MYNKYSYNVSSKINLNINLNIVDCFEKINCNSENINDILNKINSDFIKDNYPTIETVETSTKSNKPNKPQIYSKYYTKSTKYS
jgi:hypothetical protein